MLMFSTILLVHLVQAWLVIFCGGQNLGLCRVDFLNDYFYVPCGIGATANLTAGPKVFMTGGGGYWFDWAYSSD